MSWFTKKELKLPEPPIDWSDQPMKKYTVYPQNVVVFGHTHEWIREVFTAYGCSSANEFHVYRAGKDVLHVTQITGYKIDEE